MRERLSLIADLAEKGFAPRSFSPPGGWPRSVSRCRCDRDSVDRFLAELASQAAAAGLRVLPELGPGTQRPLGGRWTQQARDCKAQWQAVSDLPGARLRRAGRKIIGSRDEVLLARTRRQLTLADGQVLSAGSRNLVELPVISRSGDPIMWLRGYHFDYRAKGIVLLPGQRFFVFPVTGTRRGNAVMTAVSECGGTMLWFRKTRQRGYEIVVSPECDITAEVLCVIQLTAGWLRGYFTSSDHLSSTVNDLYI